MSRTILRAQHLAPEYARLPRELYILKLAVQEALERAGFKIDVEELCKDIDLRLAVAEKLLEKKDGAQA